MHGQAMGMYRTVRWIVKKFLETTEQLNKARFNHEQKSGIKSITVENKPVKITPRKQTMNIVSLCKNNFLP